MHPDYDRGDVREPEGARSVAVAVVWFIATQNEGTWLPAGLLNGDGGDVSDEPAQPRHAYEDTATARLAIVPGNEECREVLDLASHRPGQLARQQARTAKVAAPVRSLLARFLGVRTDERAWRIGADGEEMVAAQVHKLMRRDPRWRVLHAIPVGSRGSDIDHLVIGPGGVFALNAKHHPRARIWVGGNTFMINGTRQPYVRNSRHEASRASRLLTASCGFPVEAAGVIVPVNVRDLTVKTAPADVHVVGLRRLRGWLGAREELLDDATIELVYSHARRPSTWR